MSALRLTALLCASAMCAESAWAQDAFVTQLQLPTRGRSVDAFAWRDPDGISVERESLLRLGIAPPPGARVRLADVPGLSYREATSAAAIVMTCAAACYAVQRVGAREAMQAPGARPWGGYVNYDFAFNWAEGERASLGAILETNVFGPLGRGEASWIAHPDGRLARLETHWTIDAPQQRVRVQLGDSIWPTLGGGALRYGGIQIGRHFALAPREILHPTPILRSDAERASTVELYVDGALRARQRVEAGPFELEDAPFARGAGEAHLVVTDVLGRQHMITRPFLVSSALLRPGLADWSFAAGAERRAFSAESASYGAGFAAGQYRLGLTNNLTAEIGGEWREDGPAAQLGAAFAHVAIGEINLNYAHDAGAGALAVAWRREARAWSFSVQGEMRDAAFRSFAGARAPRYSAAANASWRMGEFGDVSFTAASVGYAHDRDARTFALSYTPEIGDAALSIRLAYTEADQADLTLAVGVSLSLRGDVTASLGGQWDRRGARYRIGAQNSPPTSGGLGWRARAAAGRSERVDAAVAYRGAHSEAQLSAGVSHAGAAARVDFAGAFGWVENEAFAARPIHGAFALVDTGAPGVGVSRDRLRIGASGADGRIVAVNLRPYDANVIAIDAEDLPLDRAPAQVTQRITPWEGAGVLVRFADTSAALVETHARFASGMPAPRGDALMRARDGRRFPIGADGRVVLYGPDGADDFFLESDPTCRGTGAATASVDFILHCAAPS